ncbi:MAG: Flp pilus assembly protein CpaB [Pirellulaceae bacterium]
MRMKSLILIFIALGCGLVASIGISQVMDRGNDGGNVEMEQILVALADVDIGTKLDAQNVKLEDWPKAKVPEGAIRRLDDVAEKFANARFYKGEPIHISKVTDNSRSVADGVPEGYRAMPVKVEEDTVMKAISPGDRVDVMVFLRKSEDVDQTGVFTILKSVRVFAVNTNTERSGSESGGKPESVNFRTISLLLKPDQTRDLALAAQVGKILLTLRRSDEPEDELATDMTPIGDLLKGKAKMASEPAEPGSTRPGPGSFLGMLQPAIAAPAPAAAPQLAWKMTVSGPNEVKQYEWQDVKDLPVESSYVATPAASGAAAQPEPVEPTTPENNETTQLETTSPAEGTRTGGVPQD